MTASPVRRGAPAGVAALAVAAVLALPAWGQTSSQAGEQVDPAAQAQPDSAQNEPSGETAGQPAGTSAEITQPDQSAPADGAVQPEGTAETAPQANPAATEGAAADYVLGDIALGDPEAPLTIYEYASFTCPHCATFHMQTFPEFREKYIDTGKVRFVLREVYFDQYGLWASMVARCGGEQGFYPLVDAFLSSQATWTRAPDIGHAIQQVGRRAGLPAERLQQCLSDREFAKQLLEDYQENRDADEIQSTPTFVINGEKHTGAMSFDDFSTIVDAAL